MCSLKIYSNLTWIIYNKFFLIERSRPANRSFEQKRENFQRTHPKFICHTICMYWLHQELYLFILGSFFPFFLFLLRFGHSSRGRRTKEVSKLWRNMMKSKKRSFGKIEDKKLKKHKIHVCSWKKYKFDLLNAPLLIINVSLILLCSLISFFFAYPLMLHKNSQKKKNPEKKMNK